MYGMWDGANMASASGEQDEPSNGNGSGSDNNRATPQARTRALMSILVTTSVARHQPIMPASRLARQLLYSPVHWVASLATEFHRQDSPLSAVRAAWQGYRLLWMNIPARAAKEGDS
ncbi:uncharacterized protein N7496_011830 [Penicillium cataractarum]|uniref:Uncharacterized protein n=1 Tax=Penicillium cataractarum TaxID=2100454 RepID=A0A9W9RG63_9EURO|nr:uncharacterized protein N7496_011830 [Penicillium cataractarum]KAJ5359417.1 hypothetical protein N7496_011830 [Penicillium cataractarum]